MFQTKTSFCSSDPYLTNLTHCILWHRKRTPIFLYYSSLAWICLAWRSVFVNPCVCLISSHKPSRRQFWCCWFLAFHRVIFARFMTMGHIYPFELFYSGSSILSALLSCMISRFSHHRTSSLQQFFDCLWFCKISQNLLDFSKVLQAWSQTMISLLALVFELE